MSAGRWILGAIAAGAVVIAGLAAWSSEYVRLMTGRWYTKVIYADRGTYFRLKFDVTYRGEPQHFDIVFGCNVHDIVYKDGSSSRHAGLIPGVYGRRMSDGKAIVVKAPNACRGETTANGYVPEGFTPLLVVYDDPKRLDFGTAYMATEAYDSPLSLMKFGKAVIEKADREEFDDFRHNGPPNLVTREQYNSFRPDQSLAEMGLKRTWPRWARTCYAYARYRLNKDQSTRLAALWPASKPRYWTYNQADLRTILDIVLRVPLQRDDEDGVTKERHFVNRESFGEGGIPNRDGAHTTFGPSLSLTPSFYPVSSELTTARWSTQPAPGADLLPKETPFRVNQIQVDENGRNRGFGYCFNPAFVEFSVSEQNAIYNSAIQTVNGTEVFGTKGDVFEPTDSKSSFENIDYMYSTFDIELAYRRGDI